MNSITTNIIVGIVSSVVGAILVLLGSRGWQITKKSRETKKQIRKVEEEQWKSMDMGVRQGITNTYLFDILKFLLLGNLFLAIPTMVTMLDFMTDLGFISYRVISTSGGILAFAFFFMGLGRASRYMVLRSMDNENREDE